MNKFMRMVVSWLRKKLVRQFITGIIVAVPIGVTIWILIWLFNVIDGLLQPLITLIWGHPVTGVGFGVTIALIYLAGVIASNVIGKHLVHYLESATQSIPVVSLLYRGMKEILVSFFMPGKSGFVQVVLIEFPRKGIKAIGFVTSELRNEQGKKLYSVLIPNSPNPTSGYLQIVGEKEIIKTNISVETAIKMVVSAGKASPKSICFGEENANPPEQV